MDSEKQKNEITSDLENNNTQNVDENNIDIENINEENSSNNDNQPSTLEDEGYTDGIEVATPSVKREDEITYRLGEIAVILDEYTRKLYDEDQVVLTDEEVQALNEETKALKKELKELRKNRKDTFWDKIKLWQLIYAIIQFIICVPFLGALYRLTYWLYTKLNDWFGDKFTNMSYNFQYAMQIIMVFAFPILNLFITWLLYANLVNKKNKFDKVFFIVVWVVQFVFTVVSMLLIFI